MKKNNVVIIDCLQTLVKSRQSTSIEEPFNRSLLKASGVLVQRFLCIAADLRTKAPDWMNDASCKVDLYALLLDTPRVMCSLLLEVVTMKQAPSLLCKPEVVTFATEHLYHSLDGVGVNICIGGGLETCLSKLKLDDCKNQALDALALVQCLVEMPVLQEQWAAATASNSHSDAAAALSGSILSAERAVMLLSPGVPFAILHKRDGSRFMALRTAFRMLNAGARIRLAPSVIRELRLAITALHGKGKDASCETLLQLAVFTAELVQGVIWLGWNSDLSFIA